MPLYTAQPTALTVLHGDIERHALEQREAFVGTAGAVIERTNAAGFRYYVHKANDADGRPREKYLVGPVGAVDADASAAALRARILEVKALVPRIKLLGREGFSLVDARTYAALAALHNRGVFAAGGLLIGSHAYGVVLNRLGIRAAPYKTQSIEVVGRVPELGAHATGLPLLDYLLVESQLGMAMYREGCCAVRVPVPERFAIHKLLVSQLRTGRDAKSRKDLEQAATLAAAVADLFPGVLEVARAAVPRRAAKQLRAGLQAVQPLLAKESPRAWDELTS